jgi:hypothetical protein
MVTTCGVDRIFTRLLLAKGREAGPEVKKGLFPDVER